MENDKEISTLEFLMPDDADENKPDDGKGLSKAEADTEEVGLLMAFVSKLLKAA